MDQERTRLGCDCLVEVELAAGVCQEAEPWSAFPFKSYSGGNIVRIVTRKPEILAAFKDPALQPHDHYLRPGQENKVLRMFESAVRSMRRRIWHAS